MVSALTSPSLTNPRPTGWHNLDLRDDAAVAAFVQQVWRERSAKQVRAELYGEQAQAWYEGEQYLFPAPCGDDHFRIEPLPNPDDRLRIVFNLFTSLVDQLHARILMDPLEPEAVPTSASMPDVDATRLQTGVCRYYRDRLNLERVKDELCRMAVTEAKGFTKVTWDPLAGSEFTLSRTDARNLQLDGDVLAQVFENPDAQEARLNLGELAVTNVHLRNLTWGPVGVPFEQAEYVVEACERSRSYCGDRWGLDPDELTSGYEDAATRWYRGSFGAGGSLLEEEHPDLIVTYELWAPRSPRHPQGVHGVVIGQQVVNRKRNRALRNPYRHGQVPYVACDCLTVTGSPLPKTPVWDLFQPQGMVNSMAARIMEIVEWLSNPETWCQEDEVVNEYELRAHRGGVHYYKNRKPEIAQGPDLPSSLYAVFDRWLRIMQDAIGIHDVSLGKAPAAGRSGRYVLALQDADNTRIGPILKNITRWAEDLFRLILCVVQQFVTEKRLIAIRGADNAWERRAFTGRQLVPGGTPASGPEAFNVQIRTSGQARSRAAQIELVTMLIQFGFFRPEVAEDRQQVMTILELGEASTQLDEKQIHRDLQRRVHEILLTGRYVPPAYYHNHDERLIELHRFMNTDDYARLPEEIQGLFARYEADTIKLQAVRPAEVQALVSEAQSAFAAHQATMQRWQTVQAQLAQLEQRGGPELQRINTLLANKRAAVLAPFLGGQPGGTTEPSYVPAGGPPPASPNEPQTGAAQAA